MIAALVWRTLKVFEGYLRKLMTNMEIDCGGHDGLAKCFVRDSKYEPFELTSKWASIISEEKVKTLERAYNFYSKKRHPYSHATGYDVDTRIIEDKKVAKEIFNDTINLIKSSYKELK